LIDPTTLCPKLSTVNVPNAKYEEVEFKFEKSILAGRRMARLT
jgi:hypothetical protein